MQWKFSAIAILSASFVIGCNKGDDTSGIPVNPAADTTTLHPTTQQLLTGPRTALDLQFAPVTLQVPMGWEVKSFNQGTWITLEGQTPTDLVSISIPVHQTITVDQEQILELHAKKDLDLHPDLLQKLGVHDISGAKVIEHLVVDPIQPTTQIATTAPTTEPIRTLQWTFTICVPTDDGKGFTAYDLRFLGMTLKQYKADQEFLRSIMDSLTYTPQK